MRQWSIWGRSAAGAPLSPCAHSASQGPPTVATLALTSPANALNHLQFGLLLLIGVYVTGYTAVDMRWCLNLPEATGGGSGAGRCGAVDTGAEQTQGLVQPCLQPIEPLVAPPHPSSSSLPTHTAHSEPRSST